MNKTELIAAVASKCSISKKEAEAVVLATFDSITNALVSGEKVQIVGFGGFEVRERPAHKGHNPMTGEEIEIAASKSPLSRPARLSRKLSTKPYLSLLT